MSTRATYTIKTRNYDGEHTSHFYIHHDGYADGAAQYFANMLDASLAIRPLPADDDTSALADLNRKADPINSYEARGGWAFHFIRGNGQAEMTSNPDDHGDTDFHYDLDATGAVPILSAHRIAKDWDDRKNCYVNYRHVRFFHGPVNAFVNQYPGSHGTAYGAVKFTPYSDGVFLSIDRGLELADRFLTHSDRYSEDNPNRAGYRRRAEVCVAMVKGLRDQLANGTCGALDNEEA